MPGSQFIKMMIRLGGRTRQLSEKVMLLILETCSQESIVAIKND